MRPPPAAAGPFRPSADGQTRPPPGGDRFPPGARPPPTTAPKPIAWCVLCKLWESVQWGLQQNRVDAHELFLFGYIAAQNERGPICSRHRHVVSRMSGVIDHAVRDGRM
jgi:hypothetical protein